MPVQTPERDHRYMLNVVTSAIVNTPPPAGVLKMVNQLSSKVHKTMHGQDTDEIMVSQSRCFQKRHFTALISFFPEASPVHHST